MPPDLALTSRPPPTQPFYPYQRGPASLIEASAGHPRDHLVFSVPFAPLEGAYKLPADTCALGYVSLSQAENETKSLGRAWRGAMHTLMMHESLRALRDCDVASQDSAVRTC